MSNSAMPSSPIDPLFDLTGKIALVTGGSRGLGYEMVKAFAAHGADIIIASRKLDACEAVADEVGYEDASFFGRLFRRKVGLTPAQYRLRFSVLRKALAPA